MAVDGIGKGGPRPPSDIGGSTEVQRPDRARADEPFGIQEPGAVQAPAATPLEQLQRGEITLTQYLDLRVESAVAHLAKSMDAAELDFVRQTLRDQLTTDPVLMELVQRATGSAHTNEP